MNEQLKNAVLIGIQLPGIDDQEFDGSLQELTRLVNTLGYKVVGKVVQKRDSDRSPSVLGAGKLKELAQWTGGTGVIAAMVERKLNKAQEKWKADAESNAVSETDDDSDAAAESDADTDSDIDNEKHSNTDLVAAENKSSAQIVVVDTDLSPSQLRNLESATGVTVLDRTGVIIEIFSRHARTKAARLQVEIAKLVYVAPRLRETGGGEDRQGGGIGGKGAGESSLELDRRKNRDRIKELKKELESIGTEYELRRAKRQRENIVALVGYTNAGKSSLMRAMTQSDVLVQDKLFATLDTTVRPLFPETKPKVLLSDTVGFIKKLPHDLVASFRSTLDEALHASLLLYVVDASDPSFRSQLQVTKTVLSEEGAGDIPSLMILNKRDRLSAEQTAELMAEFPDAIFLSTRDKNDLKLLREKIMGYFETDMIDQEIFVPYLAKGMVGEIREKMRVLDESYNETGTTFKIRGKKETIESVLKKLQQP
jgi:GTP-binding protein HflX